MWLAGEWGAPGVVWGLVIASPAITAWFVPFAACRMLDDSFRRFAGEVSAKGVIMLGLSYGVIWLLEPLLESQGRLARVAAIWSASGGAGLVLLFGFWLRRGEREWLRMFLLGRVRVG